MKLYHKDIFMPERIKNLGLVSVSLVQTQHALHAANTDRYGEIMVPNLLTFRGRHVVEAETDCSGKVIKLVVRRQYSATLDVCYAIALMRNSTTVILKTVWLNERNDNHLTLRREAYATA